jgi:ribosomal protein S27AE
MGNEPQARPQLRLVAEPLDRPRDRAWFCGRCAAPAPEPTAPTARVCPGCGFGVLLAARVDVVPGRCDAYMVIDSSLLVQALSRGAENLLAVPEELAINRSFTELLAPADAEAKGSGQLASAIAAAAADDEVSFHVLVRPWNVFGVRMRAKVAPCGPPRAALIVLEPANALEAVPDARGPQRPQALKHPSRLG